MAGSKWQKLVPVTIVEKLILIGLRILFERNAHHHTMRNGLHPPPCAMVCRIANLLKHLLPREEAKWRVNLTFMFLCLPSLLVYYRCTGTGKYRCLRWIFHLREL